MQSVKWRSQQFKFKNSIYNPWNKSENKSEDKSENSYLSEWLKLRHLIDETDDDILISSAVEIFDVLGGIKSHLKLLLKQFKPHSCLNNKNKLNKMIKLLQKKDDIPENNENNNNNNNNKIDIKSLPSDIHSYLCSFLSFRDIHFFQLTSHYLALICLDELKKDNIGLIPFDTLINKTGIIDCGNQNELIINYRMYRNMRINNVYNKFQNEYNISYKNALFYPIRHSSTAAGCHRMSTGWNLNRDSFITDIPYNKCILFNLKNVYKLGFQTNNNSNSVSNSKYLYSFHIIIKYFDIFQQKLHLIGSILINRNKSLIIFDLLNLIRDKIIQNKLNVLIQLNNMNQFESNINQKTCLLESLIYRKLLLFRECCEYPRRCVQIGKNDLNRDYRNIGNKMMHGDIIIFQLNPKHPYFAVNNLQDDIDKDPFEFGYNRIKKLYDKSNISHINNSNLESEYKLKGLLYFNYVSSYCRYREEFKKIKLIYRYPNKMKKWNDIIIEMNENSTYGMIRKQIGLIYNINPLFIEIWIPASVISSNIWEYTPLYRGSCNDSIKSIINNKHYNNRSIKWEVVGYSSIKYDDIIEYDLRNDFNALNDIDADNDNDIDIDIDIDTGIKLAIYRIHLISPDLNIDANKNKYIDIIYNQQFEICYFIIEILLKMYNKSHILRNEYLNIFGNEFKWNIHQKYILNNNCDFINNKFILFLNPNSSQILYGFNKWKLPQNKQASNCTNMYLAIFKNEDMFQISFKKAKNININTSKAMVFKFWKYDQNNKAKICGKLLRINIASNDSLFDIINNKLSTYYDITNYCNKSFYLNGYNNIDNLGTKIDENNYKCFYPFSILLHDKTANINVVI